MASPAQGRMFFANRASDALLAYLIKSYTEVSHKTLGRTILQKLCYFSKASGAPLPFRFEIYHYGPFSQEIFDRTEALLLDDAITDRSSDRGQSNFVPGPQLDSLLSRFSETLDENEEKLRRIAVMFSRLDPSDMELLATIHYMHASHRDWFKQAPSKESVVASVLGIKGSKFAKSTVDWAYNLLRDAWLVS